MGPLIRARTTCPILPIFKPAPISSIAGAMTQKRLDAFFTSTKPAKAAPTDQGTTDTSGNNGNNGNKKQKTAVGPADPANAAVMRANANRNLALAKQAVIACEKTGSVPALADLLIDSSWKGALSEEVRSSAWARARNFSLTRSLVHSFARSLVHSFTLPRARQMDKPYFKALERFVQSAWNSSMVFPPKDCVFRAYNAVPLDQVKVVILGQVRTLKCTSLAARRRPRLTQKTLSRTPTTTLARRRASASPCPRAKRSPAACETSTKRSRKISAAPCPRKTGAWSPGA